MDYPELYRLRQAIASSINRLQSADATLRCRMRPAQTHGVRYLSGLSQVSHGMKRHHAGASQIIFRIP
jgi:hypothetical protein